MNLKFKETSERAERARFFNLGMFGENYAKAWDLLDRRALIEEDIQALMELINKKDTSTIGKALNTMRLLAQNTSNADQTV